jgi:hypothetical protein
MDGMVFDHDSDEDDDIGHLHTGTFAAGRQSTPQDEGEDQDDKEKGKKSGGIFGDQGGVLFDEADGFDSTDLQGLPYYDFVSARRKGLPLRKRMTDQAEQYLRTFIDDAELRSHIYEVAASERGYPTLLLDTGHIVQFHLYANDLDRVRVSSDIDPEIGVRLAMKAFAAAGKSLDPKDVKFGNSPEFERRMKPIWVAEYKRIQGGAGRKPHIDIPRSSDPVSTTSVRRAPTVGI